MEIKIIPTQPCKEEEAAVKYLRRKKTVSFQKIRHFLHLQSEDRYVAVLEKGKTIDIPEQAVEKTLKLNYLAI